MGASPSSQYDLSRRRAQTARRDYPLPDSFLARRRATTYGMRSASVSGRGNNSVHSDSLYDPTGYIVTPFELKRMMDRLNSVEGPESESDHHSDRSPSPSPSPPIESMENMMPLTAKLSVTSADSGLESEGGMSPRGEEKKKEKKERRFKIGKKARKISQRFRSKSFTSLFSPSGDKPAPLFGNSLLNREWEIVTVQEMCRRLSLDHLDVQDMPIPEGANSSVILDELMIRQIMEILPARAEGYPWVSIYNSEKHGFSLSTLYRKMAEFDEDMSPVLLIIRDTKDHVFGCVVSSAIRPSDHFLGTGDSCLLFRFTGEVPHTRELRHYSWTGENQFFVHAQKDCLSIGAGHGHNGLWIDADLNHGRSQRCDTFDNEPLAGESEDFIVQFVEAFGFRI